jgi:hypothetical protein
MNDNYIAFYYHGRFGTIPITKEMVEDVLPMIGFYRGALGGCQHKNGKQLKDYFFECSDCGEVVLKSKTAESE